MWAINISTGRWRWWRGVECHDDDDDDDDGLVVRVGNPHTVCVCTVYLYVYACNNV